jgi:OmpA-OmpF porin, OOP family
MPALTKFLIGVAATALLAWLWHGPLGYGARFIDQLEQSTTTAVAGVIGANGIVAQFDRDHPLERVATLSGPPTSVLERERIRAEVLAATPGLFDVRWSQEAHAKPVVVADTGKPANPEQVKTCQSEIDSAIKGKIINFTSGGSVLTSDSTSVLDAVAAALGPCSGTRVLIEGHTDAAGGSARNMRLSEERANVVVQALVDRGLPPSRLLPRGFGETKPIDPGESVDAFAKNRRIAFSVASAAQ